MIAHVGTGSLTLSLLPADSKFSKPIFKCPLFSSIIHRSLCPGQGMLFILHFKISAVSLIIQKPRWPLIHWDASSRSTTMHLSLALFSTILLASSSLSTPLVLTHEQFALTPNSPTNLTGKVTWKDCGLGELPVHIQGIEVSPNPPKPGQDLIIRVTAKVTEVVQVRFAIHHIAQSNWIPFRRTLTPI